MIESVLRLAASLAMVGSVHAQASSSGWTLVARFVPNPLPAGRCGRADIEIRDKDGYRTTQLSNQQPVDSRQFQYTLGATQLTWRNGDPTDGYLCAPATATRSTTMLTVKTPDGIAGSVDVITLAPGQVAAAVQYPSQAPLRRGAIPLSTALPAVTATTQVVSDAPPASQSAAAPASASAFTVAPSGPGTFYLTIKGKTQGQLPAESPRGIAATSLAFQLSKPLDASGLPSGRRQYGPLTVAKEWSLASTGIYTAMVSGEVLTTVQIDHYRTGTDGKEVVAESIRLMNATIVGVRYYTDGGKEMEEVSFVFQQLVFTNNSGNTVASDTWPTRS